ncbi:ABC transporter substrate-binding protein [Tautonia plasticadhaerens]|uniref:Bacterial extracellular solute-binding protein, family 5 Middle n=1 Tax=Tautonia plasticadhaerens TaxID=2527974 RepID=A0A518H844_9BACT|nr:ABC transporter substrate-binding protein [Tautonia plasticadhaerens]QDV37029.1 Bacterial extracellular solute-binding protein, family 5 Middle [Tautonia plasticadhaerens]
MHPLRLAPRPLAAGLVALVVVISIAGGGLDASQLPDVPIPTDRDLLRDPPFDRLTLIDGTVLFVDPVSPRPLPDKEAIRAAEAKEDPPFERVGGLLVSKAPDLKRDPSENAIVIRTQDEEPKDYYVKITSIQRADYFEDILLSDALRRANSSDFDRAFELVLAVQTRDADWRGLRETADRIALLEGRDALTKGRVDEGLRLLGELYKRSPEYPGLPKLLAEGYSGRIKSAFDQGAFATGRRVLSELRSLAPESPEAAQMEQRFITRARRLAEQADDLTGPDRVERLAQALRIWSDDEEIARQYEEAFRQAPVLDVAVIDVSRRPGPFVECPADGRVIRLLYLPILADTTEAATLGDRPDQLAAELTSGDIGRRLNLRIKEGFSWNDDSRAIGAADVARALADRALPSTIGFDARWADLLSRVTILGEREVEVTLRRAPLDPAGWLLIPVGPAHAGRDGLVWTPDGPRPIGSGPFVLGPLTPRTARLDRAEVSSSGTIPIARVEERRFSPEADPVAALLRGEVSLLESVPLARLEELGRDPEIRVGRYRSPRMHWIAIDGRNAVLRNRSLRRGLSFAVDRVELLQERVLRRPLETSTVPSDGPFPVGSFADASDVAPLGHDPLLAKMLVRAAKQEMELDEIELTLAYPAIPAARAVVPGLVEAFAEAGVKVTPAERPQSDLEGELRRGGRFDLAYRAAPVDDPIRDAGPVLCPGYLAPTSSDGLGAIASPRILQLLLGLEQVQDLPTARDQVIALDREARDELPILPLWQLQEHYAWRTRLTGPAEEADALYEGIESWTIEPWFEPDER